MALVGAGLAECLVYSITRVALRIVCDGRAAVAIFLTVLFLLFCLDAGASTAVVPAGHESAGGTGRQASRAAGG